MRSESSRTGPVAAIVPCAGRSLRMGRSKALLDAQGRPFLCRVVEALSGGGAGPVVVVVRQVDSEEAALALRVGAEVVENPDPDDPRRGGPASSVRAGLAALPGTARGVLVHPVDYPRVAASTVRALLRAFATHPAPVTVPTWDGRRGHPVLFHRELFTELLDPELVEGARTVVRRHAAERREVAVDDPGVVDDIDTPGAYVSVFPDEAEPGGGPGERAR